MSFYNIKKTMSENKDFQILEFDENNPRIISKVLRLKDNVEFKIGEEVLGPNNNTPYKIIKFEPLAYNSVLAVHLKSELRADLVNIITLRKKDNIGITNSQVNLENYFTLNDIETVLKEILDPPELKETIKLFKAHKKNQLKVVDSKNTIEEFEIPEKWCIRAKNAKEGNIIYPFNNTFGCGYSVHVQEHYEYYALYTHKDGVNKFINSSKNVKPSEYKEIDFETFKKYILKEEKEEVLPF